MLLPRMKDLIKPGNPDPDTRRILMSRNLVGIPAGHEYHCADGVIIENLGNARIRVAVYQPRKVGSSEKPD